tara:strand:- start:555 stop:1241 length:687 start_codon:yes stop_codon:yes gene_type:complete
MDISKSKEILDYWFSKGVYTPDYDKWFMKSEDYDEEITVKFGDLLKEAEHGKGFGWLVSKDSYVAHIILMDQFSRHIYRGKGDAFKNDKGCLIFVELGWELYKEELKGYEFMFAFMPFMHTENALYQKKGKEHFHQQLFLYRQEPSARVTKRPLTEKKDLNGMFGCTEMTKYDKEWEMLKSMEPHITGHKQTIQMFGRFPKRNEALGRETTIQEQQYLNREDVKKRPY